MNDGDGGTHGAEEDGGRGNESLHGRRAYEEMQETADIPD
jgi:hypothetical protein